MWIPSLGCEDSPGIGNGNPLQYSCLENPMGRGALQVTVYGFAKNRTQVSTYPHLNNEWMSSELDFQVKGRRRHAPECGKFQNLLFTDSCPINLSYFWDPLGAVMTSALPAVLQRKSVNIPTHFILLSFWKWESKGLLCLLESPRQADRQSTPFQTHERAG